MNFLKVKTLIYSGQVSIRKARSSFVGTTAQLRYYLKRHYHLHLQLKKKDKVWHIEKHFMLQDRQSKNHVALLHGTLTRSLVPLKNHMKTKQLQANKDYRIFRGSFVKTVREFRGLSKLQLCKLINCHQSFGQKAVKYHSLWNFFPIDAVFLEKFEENTSSIMEDPTMGLFSGIGCPTKAFTEIVAEVCLAQEDYEAFLKWYEDVQMRKLQAKNQN